jgi:UDP-N-acetylglucosamine--N-acetylmuramyl-(pentapeptide) pyrophosphoryl-undecaprenol N-acetylglucosamine transferase
VTTVVFAGGGTGGHLYPGLAIARALVRLRPDVRPFFIGARRGIEKDVLPTTEFAHELLDLHPLYRRQPWSNWKTAAGMIGAWRRFGRLAAADRPAAVVGTGGYASGLALAWAWAHRVPYALQEQNSFPGLTMRLFARRAREVWLGFPEAAARLKTGAHTAVVDSGNPIDPPPVPRPDRGEARRAWGLPDEGRVLLVFGGSQGAAAVNDAVSGWLTAGRLPEGLHLVWATGKGSYDRYAHHDGARVKVRPYLAPMRDAYAVADLAVARAGAMGTAEMCAWGIPAILVPLPTAAADHQTANARALADAGAALMLPQRELTADRLDTAVRALAQDDARLATLAAGATARGRPEAAETIARRLIAMIEG